MKMMKRGLALLLALVLVAGYVPVRAEAKETPFPMYVWGFGEQTEAVLTYGTVPTGYNGAFQSGYIVICIVAEDKGKNATLKLWYNGSEGKAPVTKNAVKWNSQYYPFFEFEWSEILSETPDVGTYKLTYDFTPDDTDRYESLLGAEWEFKVNPKSITPTITLDQDTFTYDGNAKTPAVTVRYEGTTFTKDTDYTVSYENNTDAGTATVKISDVDGGNYVISGSKTFTINAADPEIGTVSYTGADLYDTNLPSAVTLNRANTKVPGTLALTDSVLTGGTQNYNWKFTPDSANYTEKTGTISLTILQDEVESLSVSGTAEKDTYIHGDVFETTGLTVTAHYKSGYTKNVTADVTSDPLSWGQTSVQLNYGGKDATYSGIEVDKKTMNLTVTPYIGVYDGREHGITISGAPDGASITYSTEKNGEYTATPITYKNAGTDATVYYKVEADNYNPVSDSATINITAADMVLTVKGYEGIYDGQEHGITITGAEGAKIYYKDSEDGTYTTTPITLTNVGEKQVWVKAEKDNYNTFETETPVVICVNPKTVVVEAGIKIDGTAKYGADAKIEYGDAAPSYVAKITGLVDGEKSSEVIEGIPSLDCEYKQGDNAGEYLITVDIGTLSAKNYTFAPQNSKLVVDKKELQVTWSDQKVTYDSTKTNRKPTATLTGILEGDTVSADVKVYPDADATTPAAVKDVGTYVAKVTLTGADKDNYTLPETASSVEFKIEPAPQTAPTGLGMEKESILNYGDGKITGVNTQMEYRKDGETTYTEVTGTTITKLTTGKYFVRYAEKTNYAASSDVEVIVEADKTLKVTVPAATEQVGYTLTVDKADYGYNDDPVLTLTVSEGYTLTDDFVMTLKIGEDETEVKKTDLTYDSAAKKYTYNMTDLQKDAAVTVAGVADITPPAVKVTLGEADFTTLIDKTAVKFEQYKGIGTKVTAAVTTTGGSNATIMYLEANAARSQAELDAIENEDWETYPAAGITPSGDGNKIFYFKAVDASGNESEYVSTIGFIYDGTAPKFSLAAGTYGITKRVTVSDTNLKDIEINDAAQMINDRTAITYRMVKDQDEDKAATYKYEVVDKAGNTSTATYTINPMAFTSTTKSWSKGSKKTADFKVNAVLSDTDEKTYGMKFVVKIDSKEIDAKNYTIEEATDGSGTVVKLKTSYLGTLKAAKHKIQVSVTGNKSGGGTETLDSTDVFEFTVSDNPATGDDMNLPFWGGLAMGSLLCAMAMMVLLSQKKGKYNR